MVLPSIDDGDLEDQLAVVEYVEDNCSSNSHTIISISDSIDSCTQETRQKTSIQLKARKPRTLSLTAMLATQSEVCLNT